jgi:hypothetical protein
LIVQVTPHGWQSPAAALNTLAGTIKIAMMAIAEDQPL